MKRTVKVGMILMVLMVAVLLGGERGALAAEPIKVGFVGIMTGTECPQR